MLLSCQKISKSFGAHEVLKEISFQIQNKDRIGVVGPNGAGKTTLLKIITGELPPDAGVVSFAKHASWGQLSQNVYSKENRSIYSEMETVFAGLIEMEATLRRMEKEMSLYQGDALENHMKSYSALLHSYEEKNAYAYQKRIAGVLKGLGFEEADFQKEIATLSGGQMTRLSLGKLLLTEPDLLLLDEPTNHLDMDSVQWLETFLNNYTGAIFMISHDRFFLDACANSIMEINFGKAKVFAGNYSQYAVKRNTERESQLKRYEDQQKEIKRQETIIKTLKSYNREKSIKRAESREKLLEKVERIEAPEQARQIHFQFTPARESGQDVCMGESLAMAFDGHPLFENVSFHIQKGDRIAIIGPNGIGKTTLVKIIMGLLEPVKGSVRLGANVKIAYYDQSHSQLTESNTIVEEMQNQYPAMTTVAIRNALGAFGFYQDEVFQDVGSLSGGEKGRVILAKLMLSGANFLLLDEPTNHLDMDSKEILEKALQNYTGTLLYISHDRYFINQTANIVWDLTPGGIHTYPGNYQYYLEKKKANSEAATVKTEEKEETGAKKQWLDQKERNAAERKRNNRIKTLEKAIEVSEAKIDGLKADLLKPENNTDPDKAHRLYQELEEAETLLLAYYQEWETLQEEPVL